jgi:hypothetical protein
MGQPTLVYLGHVQVPRTVANKSVLANIGELCSFWELARIVMALSWKPVILAVPIQAWQAARAT